MKNKKKKEKAKGKIRLTLLVRISILVLLALLVAGVLLAMVYQNYRRKKAIEQGGEAARHACAIIRNYMHSTGYREEIFQWTEQTQWDLYYLKDVFFPEVCAAMDLKYLYLFSIDEHQKRHHIITVALNKTDQENVDESLEYYDPAQELPLQENEKEVLNHTKDSALQEVDNEYGHVVNCVMGYYDETGKLIGMIGADYDMELLMSNMRKDNSYLLIIGFSAIITTFFLVLIMIHIWVLRPIGDLSRHMRDFKEDKELHLPKNTSHFQDEISDMETSFREMAKDLSNYVDDIQRMASEKAESDVQLELARRIQNGMVPPEKGYFGRGCSVYAVMRPALEVGGDFYDVFDLPMGKVGILIGDISGKGIGAALFMSIVHRIVRERLRTGMSPAKALKRANDEICRENPEDFFASVFAASWDPMSGKLTYANAGHNPPVRFGTRVAEIKVLPGDVLGLYDDAYFKNETMELEIGEGILLYTDGVTEALNPRREAYGLDRLLEQVSGIEPDSKKIVNTIRNNVLDFEGENHIFDDITMIAIQRQGVQWIRMTPDLAELDLLKECVMSNVEDQDLAKDVMMSSEEWFVNIMFYSQAKSILFDIVRENQLIKVTFADDGIPFDPTTYIGEKAFEDLDTGGMGIRMIRDLCTEIRYERVECRNVVTLVFKQKKDIDAK